MVFIELAKVSEISAPHKFDRSRSTSGNFRSIDLRFDRSTSQQL